jgi:hypothetical protein
LFCALGFVLRLYLGAGSSKPRAEHRSGNAQILLLLLQWFLLQFFVCKSNGISKPKSQTTFSKIV